MTTQYITFSISITFFSWIIGMMVNEILKKMKYYEILSNLNLLENRTANKRIGLGVFKWIVKNTFFKFFNQKLKLKNKIKKSDLTELRKEMTYAEISHLIGFCIVTIFTLIKLINGEFLFALIFMIVNTLLNLYPSLLQQENKRRIDLLIKKFN
jgi:hypothetical protein